ncbi:guanine deaminase [Methylocapsa sp. S129]|uniref:guanine deaminase n=1 Tax=Methylocapsa sp. S129 TaxID=1641869 RepID=UPI00131BE6EC|nr:guanine deaminase [Methylocapsa sp. S129]
MAARIIRGRILSFDDEPRLAGAGALKMIEDGAVLVEDGRIAAVGEVGAIRARAPRAAIDDHAGKLVMPGFIDTHIHYSQTRVIASYGAQLLEWLQKYTFVEEQKLRDRDHADIVARFFLDEMFRQGTTTAMVYCTVHPESVDVFFDESLKRGARMIAGKVMMDRNAPEGLTDDPQRGYDESKALIARWSGRGRLDYAVTPRFAITSTEAQLEASGALLRESPGAYMQTHLDENRAEIAFVKELFPWAKTYLEVYERYGLLGPRSVFGHCVHLEQSEVAALAASRSVAAFCPTSNLFLGSGLFDMKRLHDHEVRVSLATDVGGGTSYSMLQTANEAYKVLQMGGQSWPALQAFYQMTLGNSRALGLQDRIGAIREGLEADIIVLDSRATPAMAHRMESVEGDIAEELFILMMMGDDRAVQETYVAGRPVKSGLAK